MLLLDCDAGKEGVGQKILKHIPGTKQREEYTAARHDATEY